ncbi:MAG TPA: ABC transporter ATP-binding protein [Rhizomicrobium sp.]|jgi:iron complex transport system ATP-binding protein|nr:ABC transporter ATP-binding protein [Rhizomicrobium sp.]
MTAVLSFEHVFAGYRQRPVLQDVSLSFAAGEVTGLVGPNGAGKTTLFRVALQLLAPQAGNVRLLDRNLENRSAQALARALAYLPQEAEAHWPVEARRLVALGRLPHRAALAPLNDADERAIDDALTRCDATAFASRAMNQLSAGERARVLLARALAVGAPILLADEPAAHLDPAHQLRLMELLRAEAVRGTAVIVTLHDLSLASRFCDRIVVIDGGRVVADAAPGDALTDEVLRSVFAISARRLENGVVPWQRI